MNTEVIQQFIKQGKEALELADFVDAYKAYRGILEESKGSTQNFSGDFKEFLAKLRILAFPNLSDEDSADILRNNFLELLKSGIDLDGALTVKLFGVPYLVRDDLRKVLKNALIQNQQKIGMLTIGQWIQEFEKMFPAATHDLTASVRFSISHPQVRMLDPRDREILKQFLHSYDYFLTVTLPATGASLERLMAAQPAEVSRQNFALPSQIEQHRFDRDSNFSRQVSPQEGTSAMHPLEQITLMQALKLHEKLGEQSITSNPLKLRYFPAPVRSSIKNWITDYHDALGAGKHSTIDRGNYLFHSENGKRLTPAERQKMSLVLKSLDEETMLDIDVDRQAIVFEVPKPLPVSENRSSVGASNSSNFSANANPEEIAQARIRQSLNFSNSQNATAGKNQDAPVFAFEDSDYANVLRAKNSTGAESTFGNFASEKKPEVEKPAFGSLSFSSAQELPVEKKFVAPAQNSIAKFSMPAQQAKIEPPKAPQTWNSPDLRQQSSFVAPTPPAQPIQTQPAPAPAQSIQTQPVQAQLNKIESVQAQSNQIHAAQVSAPEKKPTQPTGPIVLPRNYSPYVISPSHRANNSAQNEPKIQGNTVDLS